MVSGARMLAADPLGSVGCGVGPLWTELLPEHPTDAYSDWDPWEFVGSFFKCFAL